MRCEIKDIDRRLFVVAMGVDKVADKDNMLKISLKIAIPQGDPKKGTQNFEMISLESETIADALRRAKSLVDKELDFGHTKILLVGEELAANEIRHITDWAVRRRDIQLIALMAIGKPTALDVLEIKPVTERVPGNALNLALTKDGTESPFINPMYLFELHRRLSETGLDPFLPIVQAKDNKFEISTTAIFDKQKLKATLNPDESRMFNLIQGHANLKTNYKVSTENNSFELNIDETSVSYTFIDKSAPIIKYRLN